MNQAIGRVISEMTSKWVTVIRVRPELAANEHIYFETMRAGEDETYNEGLRKAREEYFGKLSPESMESMNL